MSSELENPATPNIVTCTAFRAVQVGSTLIGYADLHLASPYRLKFFGCPVFRSDDRLSVGLPTKPHRAEAGKQKYAPVVAFDDHRLLERFSSAAAEAVLDIAPDLKGTAHG
ncbi:hypothetical protein [Rhizobium sp. Root1220]|uniref:hypothetical protein n=1 Tax=Rhizobium sp. Root1220 TaxID=1736432 RepID=UPI0006FE69B3|nr:hypothetical protein [Rhizobium sp. Root1220]KQV68046.1 hypothetical protein ASC90_10305 [Rhizobium sp. Root1220]